MTLGMRRAVTIENLESRQLLAAGFQIEFAYEASVTSAVKSVLQQAAAKWQSAITGDIPDVGAGAWGAAVDDIRIVARVKPIDGTGKGLAQSRPTYIRAGNHLPIAGEIEVDSADVSSSALLSTVTHEIGHALGFGTLWSQFSGLTTGTGGSNPMFLGNNALREYKTYARSSAPTGVPLETTGGTGTRDVHWRESTFGNELLTGFLGAGSNPLSRVTIGAMADLGYVVNYNAADSYTLPGVTPPPTTSKGSISGKVFNDLDKDGTLDSNESGLSGRGVYIDVNKSGNRDTGDILTTTDSSGNYTFSNLAAGTYNVRLYRGDLTQVAPGNNGANVVTISSGQNVSGKNFATTGSTVTTPPTSSVGKITGKVFNDADHDGVLDSNETGGWANRGVYLDTNKSGYRESSDIQATTDANGNFTFSNVPVGTYNLRLYRGDLTQTSPAGNGSISVTVTSGGTASGKNFGAYLTGAKAVSLEAWTASTTKKRDSAISSVL